VGFDAVDRLVAHAGGRWEKRDDVAAEAEAEIDGRSVTLMKPLTYMNLSGGPVSEWARAHSIDRTEVLVYFDDISLPLGRIRLRERGSDGGHRGFASVLASLGGTDVPRVRIGIRPQAPEGPEGELVDFVLAPFTEQEKPVVDEVLSRVVSATRLILAESEGGMARAMSFYNAAPSPEGSAS
jgi:PTH1 family peptidyl-tRNA hydrolase